MKTRMKSHQLPVSCPDCNGPIFVTKTGDSPHFECAVGHSFSPETFSDAHTDALERALWIAIRTLRERISIQRMLATSEQRKGKGGESSLEIAANAERDIALLQEILERI